MSAKNPKISESKDEDSLNHTSRRPSLLGSYEDNIRALSAVRASTQIDVVPPLVWNQTEALDYVRNVVYKAFDREIRDNEHLLGQDGVHDRVATAYIKNSFVKAIVQTRKGAARQISDDFVHANPTITRLTERLLTIINAIHGGANGGESSLKLQELETMISQFSSRFPEHRPTNSQALCSGEVILLTGSTGALGSQLLAYLASSPEVSHVYALNRRSRDGTSLRNRQSDAFVERDLDVGILGLPKVTLVEGDTATTDLSIDPVLLSEIRDNITLIIHNAWKVNFSMDLGSFKSNIRSVRTLVDVALGSPRQDPPRIIFTSSVTVFKNWDAEQGRPLEARIDDPAVVLGCGYGESKFVAERILENAAISTPLRPIIVRIGQLTGTSNGAWNATDWVPILVTSGQFLGVLPARDDCIAWLPLKAAAEALFDFRNSESQYLHLAHPNPAPWNSVFEIFSSRLNVPLVDWNEWVARVESRYGSIPEFRAFDMFQECHHSVPLKNREAPGIPLMDLRQALSASPSLADASLPQVGPEDAERWVRYWRRLGILSNNGGKL